MTNKQNVNFNNYSSHLRGFDQYCASFQQKYTAGHNSRNNKALINGYSSPKSLSLTNISTKTTVQLPPIEMSMEEQRALGYMVKRSKYLISHNSLYDI